jgi:nicotinamidase-related amidase
MTQSGGSTLRVRCGRVPAGYAGPVPTEPEKTALLVIDVINSYDFEDAERLAHSAREAVPHTAALLDRAREADIAVVYVNDNYGAWNSSVDDLVAKALRGEHADLVEPLVPADTDAFVVKARHSAFYQTPLEYLLGQNGVARVVLAGQVTEQCILYSALDAYIRHLDVVVATDAVAHIDERLAAAALTMMERNMDVELSAGRDCPLAAVD